MRALNVLDYEPPIYRPPSEARSLILQATIGCSWNKCTYCDMYRHKTYRQRSVDEVLADIATASEADPLMDKVFVADGDALVMPTADWLRILEALRSAFPKLRRVSCYAMATNVTNKSVQELQELRQAGLSLLYLGPETGDEKVFKRIAKGQGYAEHVEAAKRCHEAGLKQSVIFLLGAGGVERSTEHATASGKLATAMDPAFLSALTLTVVPDTPQAKLEQSGRFTLPPVKDLLGELRLFVANASPTDAVFRSNHASNYLPISGRLSQDRDQILAVVDAALSGDIALRPEWHRGL